MFPVKKIPKQVYGVIERLERGVSPEVIEREWGRKIVNRGIAALSTIWPDRFCEVFGAPASDLIIYTDECLGRKLTLPLHQTFGRVVVSEYAMGLGASDRKIFDAAMDEGVSAILTNDGRSRRPTDMCSIARDAYWHFNAIHVAGTAVPPGVIVLPQGASETLAALQRNAEDVTGYIGREDFMQRRASILDLRRQNAQPQSAEAGGDDVAALRRA